jgi:hypothetical protein
VERQGAPVLGVEHLPVRHLPGVRAGLDVRQSPGRREHDRRAAAVGVRGPGGDHGLRLPVGDLRRARHRALDQAGDTAGQVRRRDGRPADDQPARAGSQRTA